MYVPLLCYSCPPLKLQHISGKKDGFLCLGSWFANSPWWWIVAGNISGSPLCTLQMQNNNLYLNSTPDPECLEIHIIREKWDCEKKKNLMRSSDLPSCFTYNISDRCLSHLFLTSSEAGSPLSLHDLSLLLGSFPSLLILFPHTEAIITYIALESTFVSFEYLQRMMCATKMPPLLWCISLNSESFWRKSGGVLE